MYKRTTKGDQVMALLASDPGHPDVIAIINDFRRDFPELEGFPDDMVAEYLVKMLAEMSTTEEVS